MGKKYNEAFAKVEKRPYALEDAVKLAKETSTTKFDATVEVAFNLNLDTRQADQQLRGAVVLPNGTGKSAKVLVIAEGDHATAAKEAGADFVGSDDLIEKISKEN
jgi:large subunit ribosomal protein L1